MVATWDENVAAYEKMDYLEDKHFLHWAVFYDGEPVGIYDDGLAARRESLIRFGNDPYLIRIVGEHNLDKEAAVLGRRNRTTQATWQGLIPGITTPMI